MHSVPKKILSALAVLLLVGTVFGYGYYRTKDFLRGPIVEITSPVNGQMLAGALIDIAGISRNISFLNLNGRKIYTDEGGNWSEKMLLSPGYNIIEVEAKDRFGRDVTKKIEVVVQDQSKN